MTTHTKQFLVEPQHSAANVGSGLLDVLSTPSLLAFMEGTAQEMMIPHCTPEQSQVGIEVQLAHLAATPIGKTITVQASLVEHTERIFQFTIEAYDENEQLIGKATHKRAIILRERFLQSLNK